jgi:hypothetical protein
VSQTTPVPQLAPSEPATVVHDVVLADGWQLVQEFAGLTAPPAYSVEPM